MTTLLQRLQSKSIINILRFAIFLLLGLFINSPISSADTSINQIIFNSFTGVYHLSRDKRGLSLLSTDETILADFPATGYTGIKRLIPEKFQGHSVGVKILNVTDAAGNSIPYQVQSDSTNVTLTIGDPSITLSGSQTIRIRYQTSGIIDLSQKYNELLLGVNGRGWDSTFASVTASLYIPTSFNSTIKETPTCYKALGTINDNNCQVSVRKTDSETLITTKTVSTIASQGLILKVDFKPATFTNNRSQFTRNIILTIGIFIVIMLVRNYYKNNSTTAKKR